MITLYGAQCSLYTGKVRAYLRKNAIPFAERAPSHPHYRDTVLPAVQNHRIPVVEFADGAMIQDSAAILDACESRFPHVAKPTGALRVAELFIEAYAERSLLKAAMHYRWSFPHENRAFILGEFGRIIAFANGPAAWPQVGESIAGRMSAYLPPLGITAASIPAIEASYLKLLACLNAHFALYPYILGDAPSRADYGLMGPLYAHLGRDPYPARIMQREAPLVFRWVERMNAPEVHTPEYPDRAATFFDSANPPPAFRAVLKQAVAEYAGEVEATARLFADWCAKHPDKASGARVSDKGEDQPTFGSLEFPIENTTVRTMSSGHTLWMMQHALDAYVASNAAEKTHARTLFAQAGGASLLDLKFARRLTRIDNKLAIA
ncbi:MAG: glutathione S-transferase N-terminal domain-containing protein [Micropepsaceae bacterium]